jgi:tRNA (guanine-N7-)-methyltransferase
MNDFLPSFVKRRGRITRSQEKNLKFVEDFSINNENDLQNIINKFEKVVLEIGFGDGENVAHMAKSNPNNLYIASEVYLSGIGSLLGKIIKDNIKNILVYQGDIRHLLSNLNHEYFDGVIIICPDPWPKAKHHKRRLITNDFLKLIYNLVKKDSFIFISTDWEDYANSIEESIVSSRKYTNEEISLEGLQKTKYQIKADKEGRKIFSYFLRTIK